MSPLDILPRTLPRPVDAQSLRDSSNPGENQESALLPGEAESFDVLLQGLAGQFPKNAGSAQRPDDADRAEVLRDGNAPDQGRADIASAVFALLQGVLPSAGSQPAGAAEANGEGQIPLPTLPDDLEQAQAGSDPMGLPAGSKLTVAVRHQETHFKPVLDRMDTAAETDGVDALELATDSPLAETSTDKGPNVTHPEHRKASSDAPRSQVQLPPQADPPKEAEADSSDSKDVQQALNQPDKSAEARKAASASLTRDEPASLPPATLQRLAEAVKSDLQAAANSATPHSAPGDNGFQMLSIKASESVLRVLNLQLHPADLGAVTIKMKLAGESLQMELHTEREETAQLLRSDAEKLSSLLRGSGYRPDTISIHVSHAAVQSGSSPTGTQADMPLQGQSFQQGGASQENRSRSREKQDAKTSAEPHTSTDEGTGPVGRPHGGVYL